MSKISFTGTGVMGRPIVRSMMKNNLSVNIYSRTKSKTDDLVVEGAVWYDMPKVITEANDIIFTMVSFPLDVEGVYFNEVGVLQASLTDRIAVGLTTNTPALAEKIAEKTAKMGAHALGSPVSGGDLDAKNGTLTTAVGDDQESHETALPIFRTFDKTPMLHSSAGKGQHTEMVNQLVIAGAMTGLAKVFVYANATGLTLEKVPGTVGGDSAADWSLSNYGPRILKEGYTSGFFVKHFIKDLEVALDEAKRLDLTLPATQKATELCKGPADKGFENDDTQASIKLWWTDGKRPMNRS